MRYLLPLFFALATVAVFWPQAPQPPDPTLPKEPTINLWHDDEGGQGCPVSPTEALTAKHVVEPSSQMAWSYPGSAGGGVVVLAWTSNSRDLAGVQVLEGDRFARWYELAPNPPRVGDVVYLQGYQGPNWTSYWQRAVVTTMFAGGFSYDASPGQGSSGSCVLDTQGRLVGINSLGWEAPKGHQRGTGLLLAPAVWAPPAPKGLPPAEAVQ